MEESKKEGDAPVAAPAEGAPKRKERKPRQQLSLATAPNSPAPSVAGIRRAPSALPQASPILKGKEKAELISFKVHNDSLQDQRALHHPADFGEDPVYIELLEVDSRGEVVAIGWSRVVLSYPFDSDKAGKSMFELPRRTISFHEKLGRNVPTGRAGCRVISYKEAEQRYGLSHLELKFEDQFISRSDMYLVGESLKRKDGLVGEVYRYESSKFKLNSMIFSGTSQPTQSGLITPKTQITFQSRTYVCVWLIHLSSELWSQTSDGRMRIDWMIDGFIEDLLRQYKAKKVRPVIKVIFFGRINSSIPGVKDLVLPVCVAKTEGQLAELPREIRRQISVTVNAIKKQHRPVTGSDFQASISALPQDKDTLAPHSGSGNLSTANNSFSSSNLFYPAARSNLLEAVCLALDRFTRHHVDRKLELSGHAILVIGAGKGHFRVHNRLSQVVAMKMLDQGIRKCNLICIGRPPLQVVPLLEYLGSDPALVGQPGIEINPANLYHEKPEWMNILFYHPSVATPSPGVSPEFQLWTQKRWNEVMTGKFPLGLAIPPAVGPVDLFACLPKKDEGPGSRPALRAVLHHHHGHGQGQGQGQGHSILDSPSLQQQGLLPSRPVALAEGVGNRREGTGRSFGASNTDYDLPSGPPSYLGGFTSSLLNAGSFNPKALCLEQSAMEEYHGAAGGIHDAELGLRLRDLLQVRWILHRDDPAGGGRRSTVQGQPGVNDSFVLASRAGNSRSFASALPASPTNATTMGTVILNCDLKSKQLYLELTLKHDPEIILVNANMEVTQRRLQWNASLTTDPEVWKVFLAAFSVDHSPVQSGQSSPASTTMHHQSPALGSSHLRTPPAKVKMGSMSVLRTMELPPAVTSGSSFPPLTDEERAALEAFRGMLQQSNASVEDGTRLSIRIVPLSTEKIQLLEQLSGQISMNHHPEVCQKLFDNFAILQHQTALLTTYRFQPTGILRVVPQHSYAFALKPINPTDLSVILAPVNSGALELHRGDPLTSEAAQRGRWAHAFPRVVSASAQEGLWEELCTCNLMPLTCPDNRVLWDEAYTVHPAYQVTADPGRWPSVQALFQELVLQRLHSQYQLMEGSDMDSGVVILTISHQVHEIRVNRVQESIEVVRRCHQGVYGVRRNENAFSVVDEFLTWNPFTSRFDSRRVHFKPHLSLAEDVPWSAYDVGVIANRELNNASDRRYAHREVSFVILPTTSNSPNPHNTASFPHNSQPDGLLSGMSSIAGPSPQDSVSLLHSALGSASQPPPDVFASTSIDFVMSTDSNQGTNERVNLTSPTGRTPGPFERPALQVSLPEGLRSRPMSPQPPVLTSPTPSLTSPNNGQSQDSIDAIHAFLRTRFHRRFVVEAVADDFGSGPPSLAAGNAGDVGRDRPSNSVSSPTPEVSRLFEKSFAELSFHSHEGPSSMHLKRFVLAQNDDTAHKSELFNTDTLTFDLSNCRVDRPRMFFLVSLAQVMNPRCAYLLRVTWWQCFSGLVTDWVSSFSSLALKNHVRVVSVPSEAYPRDPLRSVYSRPISSESSLSILLNDLTARLGYLPEEHRMCPCSRLVHNSGCCVVVVVPPLEEAVERTTTSFEDSPRRPSTGSAHDRFSYHQDPHTAAAALFQPPPWYRTAGHDDLYHLVWIVNSEMEEKTSQQSQRDRFAEFRDLLNRRTPEDVLPDSE